MLYIYYICYIYYIYHYIFLLFSELFGGDNKKSAVPEKKSCLKFCRYQIYLYICSTEGRQRVVAHSKAKMLEV